MSTDTAKRRNYKNERDNLNFEIHQAENKDLYGPSKLNVNQAKQKSDNLLKATKENSKLEDINKHKWKGTM